MNADESRPHSNNGYNNTQSNKNVYQSIHMLVIEMWLSPDKARNITFFVCVQCSCYLFYENLCFCVLLLVRTKAILFFPFFFLTQWKKDISTNVAPPCFSAETPLFFCAFFQREVRVSIISNIVHISAYRYVTKYWHTSLIIITHNRTQHNSFNRIKCSMCCPTTQKQNISRRRKWVPYLSKNVTSTTASYDNNFRSPWRVRSIGHERRGFRRAEKRCASIGYGSEAEQDRILSVARNVKWPLPVTIWLGGHDFDVEGEWKWVVTADTIPSSFLNLGYSRTGWRSSWQWACLHRRTWRCDGSGSVAVGCWRRDAGICVSTLCGVSGTYGEWKHLCIPCRADWLWIRHQN